MRPVQLDIEGFTAFRDPVIIDFAGADLFALTGPTGAGKSSVVDAMGFALYGCVPRLDRRMVAPIISLGRSEARVRFRFTVGGESYVAARVVRRTKHGASTREARLERGADGEVLAGNERDLSSEVERLLGLGFEQFTKCVVLPQGEFMRLLHEEPAKRQDLLVSLLDVGLYGAVARVANRRATLAEESVAVAGRLLEKVAGATAGTRSAAGAEVDALSAVWADLVRVGPRLDALRADHVDARARARTATARVDLLRSVAVPDDLTNRTSDLARLPAEEERCGADEACAQRSVEQAVAMLEGRATQAHLDSQLRAHDLRERAGEQRAAIHTAIEVARVAEVEAAAGCALAQTDVTAARKAVDEARWTHRADDLVRTLVTGEACPVCRRVVDLVPDPEGADAVDAVDAAVAACAESEARLRRETAILRSAEGARWAAEARLTALTEHITALDESLEHAAPADALRATLVEVRAAEAAVHAARSTDRAARAATAKARRRREEAAAIEAGRRRRFAEVRDTVAGLEPPAVGHESLVADWHALVEWAADACCAEELIAEGAARRAEGLRDESAAAIEAIAARCAAAGVVMTADVAAGVGVGVDPSRDLSEAVVDRLARARAGLARIDADMVEATRYRAEIVECTKAARVARDLARHLSASHFEKWMLDEALGLLVAGATDVLLDLSRGDYSLALDDRANFLVIDHRCADEVRSARTLSGGETFVASLALALALADQISYFAANGAARLESIFLDEGFGTLDPDTLDTVAVALEELGARGRTVGLISHLPELAARVPVRFEVTKGSASSTVERIEV